MEIYFNIPYSDLGSSRSTIKVIKENKLSILPVPKINKLQTFNKCWIESKLITNWESMKRITIQLSQLNQLRINLIQNKRLIQGLFKYTMVYEYSTVCTTSKIII